MKQIFCKKWAPSWSKFDKGFSVKFAIFGSYLYYNLYHIVLKLVLYISGSKHLEWRGHIKLSPYFQHPANCPLSVLFLFCFVFLMNNLWERIRANHFQVIVYRCKRMIIFHDYPIRNLRFWTLSFGRWNKYFVDISCFDKLTTNFKHNKL